MTTQPNLLTALLTIRDASTPEAGLMAGVDTWSALVEELQKIAGDAIDSAPVPSADETSITINREILYRAISNHLPSDMIDAIWQEVIEALEL